MKGSLGVLFLNNVPFVNWRGLPWIKMAVHVITCYTHFRKAAYQRLYEYMKNITWGSVNTGFVHRLIRIRCSVYNTYLNYFAELHTVCNFHRFLYDSIPVMHLAILINTEDYQHTYTYVYNNDIFAFSTVIFATSQWMRWYLNDKPTIIKWKKYVFEVSRHSKFEYIYVVDILLSAAGEM